MTHLCRVALSTLFAILLIGPPRILADDSPPGSIPFNDGVIDLYPVFHSEDPGLPSPYATPDGRVTVTALMADGRYTVVPVTLTAAQRVVDGEDFPALAKTGYHDDGTLAKTRVITGRTVDEITLLGRPGGLSTSGFLAEDEDLVSVLQEDNRRARSLGLTHAELAAPLFHLVNLLELDVGVVWRNHSWDDLRGFFYHGRLLTLTGSGTKGGQQSIFDDGITGALAITLWRELDRHEEEFLRARYPDLSPGKFMEMVGKLSRMLTGEMEPQYIMRYGFYEGHTEWRTDPIAIAFVFGLKSIEEIEAAFPGRLYGELTRAAP